MTSPPSSRTAISNVEIVRSDGFSNSSATCAPPSAFAVGAFLPSARSRFTLAARAQAGLELCGLEVEHRQEVLRANRRTGCHVSYQLPATSYPLGPVIRVDSHVLRARDRRSRWWPARTRLCRGRPRCRCPVPERCAAAFPALTSCGWPCSNSTMPPMRTAACDRSNGTPERPAAATRRPQFGSPPCTAVLTSRELAMVRAARSACAHSLAPVTPNGHQLGRAFAAANDGDRERLSTPRASRLRARDRATRR